MGIARKAKINFDCLRLVKRVIFHIRAEMRVSLYVSWYIRFCFIYIACILIILKFCYLPTDAQLNCFKNNFTIHIKIDTKTAATCFGAVTPSSGRALLVLAKVTVVKIAN